MAPVTPPEHRARTRRWGREEEKRRRRRRHRDDDAAARDCRRKRAAPGSDRDDAAKVVVPAAASSSSPVKKPRRLPSQIGEVLGSLSRIHESIDIIEDDEVAVPPVLMDFSVAGATPSSTPAAPNGNPDKGRGVVLAPEALAHGGAVSTGVVAPSSSTKPEAASAVSAVFLAPITLLQASQQAPPPHDKNKPLLFTAASMGPAKRKMVAAAHQPRPPAASSTSRATAPPPLLLLPPPPQPAHADAFERQEFLKKRFSKLIAKSEKVIDDFYRENLKSGRVAAAPEPEPEPEPPEPEPEPEPPEPEPEPPEPEPEPPEPEPKPEPPEPEPEPEPPVVDEKTLALIDAERERFCRWLWMTEMKAKRDGGLFTQNARREHVRALGIDAAMEYVVSPERPRGGDGEPIVEQGRPRSPVEKLGLFVKPL